MSRLTTRGTNKSTLYSQADADDFTARSVKPHTLRWKAHAYRWINSGGAVEVLMEDIPIVGGKLVMDSSDQVRRRLTLDIGAGAELEPRTWRDPLVPFGQFIILWCSIDREDGTFFPWLKMGEFHIQSYVYERPSQIATVEALDYSAIVNEYLHTKKKSYGKLTVAAAIDAMVNPALPNKSYLIVAHPEAKTNKVRESFVSDAASPRWEQAVKVAEENACDTFWDWNGDLVIRPNLGDGNDDIIPESGPDVGTKDGPIATIRDEEGGALIGMTATVTRDGACNGVFVNIHETADQKAKDAKARAARGDSRVDVQVSALAGTGSPVMYGDTFGRIPVVFEKSVSKITDAVETHYRDLASTILARRRGVVRYIDLAMVGGYHLEPDDKVRIQFDGRTEDHYVQAITFELAGGATIVRTRELHVEDPGA
jgi:hypothetical protein